MHRHQIEYDYDNDDSDGGDEGDQGDDDNDDDVYMYTSTCKDRQE